MIRREDVPTMEFCDGFKISVGDRVHFRHGWGTVARLVSGSRSPVHIRSDSPESLPGYVRWPLNPVAAARAGATHFDGPLDNGVSGGAVCRHDCTCYGCVHDTKAAT